MATQTVKLGDTEISFEKALDYVGYAPERAKFKVSAVRTSDGVSKSFELELSVYDDTTPQQIAEEAHFAFYRLLFS